MLFIEEKRHYKIKGTERCSDHPNTALIEATAASHHAKEVKFL